MFNPMKLKNIKNINVVLVVMATVFAFPLQVIFGSPILSFLPYAFLGILFLLTYASKLRAPKIIWNTRKPIILLITIYLLMIFFHSSWQLLFRFITFEQALSAVFIYSFPVLFFIYFRFFATNQQFTVFLLTTAICGLLAGTYFIYDSYSMLVSLQLSDYSQRAFEYTQMRAPGQEANTARVTVGYRSHGLLEKHAISSAWIVFGCLAALTILPSKENLRRSFVIMIFGLMLLISLNFTSLVGFVLVVLLMEYKGYYIFRLSTYTNIGARLITITLSAGLFLFLAADQLDLFNLFETIEEILSFQVDLATGTEEFENGSFIGNLLYQLFYYPFLIIDYPIGLLIGDGFSSFGRAKGGDFGIVETLHKFGLPLFLIIFIGLIKLVFRSIQIINSNKTGLLEQKYLWFAASIISYLIFTEVHYSVWIAKSVLPILFIAIAIFDQYLYEPKLQSVDADT